MINRGSGASNLIPSRRVSSRHVHGLREECDTLLSQPCHPAPNRNISGSVKAIAGDSRLPRKVVLPLRVLYLFLSEKARRARQTRGNQGVFS